jgi:hypothetical protein
MFSVFLFLFTMFIIDNVNNSGCALLRKSKNNKKIKIISITSREHNVFTSEKNILNFLENKLLNKDKMFKEYNKPIVIMFDYLGSVNKIHMKYLSSKPNDKLLNGAGCMEAYIFVNRKKVVITEKFLEIYGHTKNFYSHIKGCYNNFLFMTLKKYVGKYIYIMNEYGKKLKYYITLGNKNIKVIHIK